MPLVMTKRMSAGAISPERPTSTLDESLDGVNVKVIEAQASREK